MVGAAMYRHLTAEQRREREVTLIEACQAWIKQGSLHEQEQSAVITELATLLLKHHRLIEATEHLIYHGWISFNQGHGPRLARLAEKVMRQSDLQKTLETECAGLLLQKLLLPFLGKTIDDQWHEHYDRIRDAFLAEEIGLPPGTEYDLTHRLMLHAMNELRFEEAQAILDTYRAYLESRQVPHLDQHRSLLCERALLIGTWCEYAEEQGDIQQAKSLREQVIALYRRYSSLLLAENAQSSLSSSLHKRTLAYCFNYLGFELSRNGQHEEALEFIERSITLKEQGYANVSGLAAAYGDKSQALKGLGRFQEALSFDEKALAEIQRCADTGDALSRDDVWIYKVNRGCLYLRLGKVEEAESLLQEALPHIHPKRRMYRMFAKQALDEIEEWRHQAISPEHQLDWRWVGRFRELVAYDGHGWLAHAGPFTKEEQQQWDQMFEPHANEDTWEHLAALMVQSRERELTSAIAEQREPRLRYPAIEIKEVRRRIAGLLQLDAEISQQEPNAIVRRLYQGAIEEDVDFLRLIEATYEGDIDKYWACNLRLEHKPTEEEMEYTLVPIKRMVFRGLTRPETREIGQQLSEFMHTHLHLSLNLPPDAEEREEEPQETAASPIQPQQTISHQAVKKFFEAALQEGGCDGWRVEIDHKAIHPRVEGGLHTFFLPNGNFRLNEVRYWFIHELAGHIALNVAGERSRLGLLGISTKNRSATEEGLLSYYERQIAALRGQTPREPRVWMGTLATGLASGVITPPQTFQSLLTFLVLYALLHQLLQRPNSDVQKAQEQAQKYALHICLRTFRGVPDLERVGICYLKDSVYLRGSRMIERAVAEDKTVLDRLAVGKVALELLPDLQELGIVSSPQPLRRLAYDSELDAHILSFAQAEEQSAQ
jgi:tetratricopeptide (TPR) repeat protein